jgi:hypothetical protein
MTDNKPTLSIDVELYQSYLDDSGLSEAQKKELLEMLWGIVCEFVMMGFNVHPVQQAKKSCAKNGLLSLPFTQAASPTLESQEKSLSQVFAAACDAKKETTTNKQKKRPLAKEITHADICPLQP